VKRIAACWLLGLLLALLPACAANEPPPPAPALAIGAPAPALTLGAVRGEAEPLVQLNELTLLGFISPGAATSDSAQASRSQIVFLKSMAEQYTDQGLRVVIVASATPAQPARLTESELLNFSYDWALDAIPLLVDSDEAEAARAYGVGQLPTTFLIGPDGLVVQRWDGYASAAQLALAIQDQLAEDGNTSMCRETPVQTPFVGYSPARQLAPQIWLVDGGQPWVAERPHPTTWIVFSAAAAPTLAVAVQVGAGPMLPLFSLPLEAVDPAAATMLPSPAPNLRPFQLTVPTTIVTAGCATLQASITEETRTLDQGMAILSIMNQ
jgi:peroxiredoxin